MIKTLIKSGLAICLATTIANAEGGIVKGEVIESIDAAGYTYLKVKTNANENKWAAVMKGDYKIGTPITITEDMTTQNFTSKALGITFDSIVFGKVAKDSMKKPVENASYKEADILKTNIAAMLKTPADFKDKVIQAEGKVIKVSEAIMKSNWIHVEDKDLNTIIFRSQNNNVKVGQEIIATGKANVDVDYGYGYKYDIIVTDSVFKQK